MRENSRLFSLDLLRVIACYLVIQIHAGAYFIGDNGVVVSGDTPYYINFFSSTGRVAVPIFLMITGFFVLPVKDRMSVFFKKRFARVVIPFIIWCVLYAFYKIAMSNSDLYTALYSILKIPVNYGTQLGHLWYVYMLIGLYLFFPMISPWIQSVSKKGMLFYLSLWAISLCVPYIHLVFPEILGECYWNDTPLLYYFSGLLGYAILGAYLKKYYTNTSKSDILLGVVLLAIGLSITIGVFIHRLATESLVAELELSWGYNTINVAAMALGVFLLFRNLKCRNEAICKITADVSNLTYGVYLAHIMVLNFFSSIYNGLIDNICIKIPVMAVSTFVVTYIIIKLLSYLPKSKYLVG